MTNKDKYKLFCESEKMLPIFSNYQFLNAVAGNENWDVLLYESDNKVVASFPYFIQKKLFSKNVLPILCKFLGPYFTSQFRSTKQFYKICDYFIKQLPKFSFFNQHFYYDIKNTLPFYWSGFKSEIKYSYEIKDLSNLETVFQNFSHSYRKDKFAKAQNIVKCVNNLSLKTFYDVNNMSLQRQNLKPFFSFEFFKNLDQVLEAMKSREVFFAVDEQNKVHAVVYLIWDKNCSYLLLAGGNTEFRSSGATVFLIWKAIEYTKNVLGLNSFDFLGSMIKQIELARRQFGASQKPYLSIEKYNSKLLEVLKILKR